MVDVAHRGESEQQNTKDQPHHSMFNRVTGLHRREATQFLEGCAAPGHTGTEGPVQPASRGEFLLPRHKCVSNPATQQGHHRVSCGPTSAVAACPTEPAWPTVDGHEIHCRPLELHDGAGWRSTGSKSDAEIVNPVSTTSRMLPCLLLSTARPKGVLQF